MGNGRVINETLVANVALLAGGTCCLALGGPTAVGIFGVLAAPTVGVGGWSLAKWFNRLSDKTPESHKAIRRIQDRVNSELTGDVAFADVDPEDLAEADNQLSKLAARFWPAPPVIAELATNMDGFPNAIAQHVIDEINGSPFATALFEKPTIQTYAKRVLSLSLEAALTDRAYFEKLEPQLFMQNLKLTGQISRDVATFNAELKTVRNVVGEALGRIETKLDDANEKLDLLVRSLVSEKGASAEEEKNIRQTIAEMLLSDRQASQDAVAELMADPARPEAATNRLKQAIAEQSDARKEATRNEIALLEEIVAINYFSNGPEAVSALEAIVHLAPNDADSWNRLGILYRRLGALDKAITAYEAVAKIGEESSDQTLQAIAFGNLGIVAKTRGDLDGAVSYCEQSLALNTELGHKEGMASAYGNLGNVAKTRGDLDGAVSYYEQSLALSTELGHKEGMASAYGNLGNVARIRGDLDGAVSYYEQSLKIEKELGRKEGMAIAYGNLGIVARVRGDLDGAVSYYEQSLKIEKELGRKEGIAIAYGNLGIVARVRGDLDGAVPYYTQALALNTDLGRKEGMAIQYSNLGIVAQIRGDLGLARSHWEVARKLFTQVGAAPHIATVSAWLKNLDNDG